MWCEIVSWSSTHADVLSSIFMDTLNCAEFLMIFIDPYSFFSFLFNLNIDEFGRKLSEFSLEMSKWVSTREPTRFTTGSSRVGLRKIQLFQKWVELNPAHLTHGLNRLEPGWRWVGPLNPPIFFYNFFFNFF